MIWQSRIRILSNSIGALVFIFLLYKVYIFAIHIYFDTPEVSGKFNRSVITTVEMHEDGVRVEKTGNPIIEVTPFLTQKTTLKLYKDVGKWQVIIGEVHAKQTISGKFTYSIVNTGSYLNETQPAFILPTSIMFDKKINDTTIKESDLEQLRTIEDGNVAELSFSVRSLMSPNQLMELLANYDIAVTGLPVYAGEVKEFDTPHSVGNGSNYSVPHLSLRSSTMFREKNQLSGRQMYFTFEDTNIMADHVANMMADLEWMTKNIKYRERELDIKRLAYLQKNGVHVYGATITGPVRELEKLKEQPEFYRFQLGHIEIWNWI